MLKHYLAVAFRNLLRHPSYAFINVAGLTVGLACCLVIFQYVAFEYSFDRFHAHEASLYRVNTAMTQAGEEQAPGAYTPHAMGPALAEAVPELERVSRVHPTYSPAVVSSPSRPERVFEEEGIVYVDPDFLEMFTFPVLSGDAAALAEPGAALVSASMAEKYFGRADPMGQVLDIAGEIDRSYRVAGIFEDAPANSHLQFDFLLPVGSLVTEGYTEPEAAWGWNNFATYVQIRPGADAAAAERRMTEVYRIHFPEAFREQGFVPHVFAQPLRGIHLNAEIQGPPAAMGSHRTVQFFTLIGLITLVIALVNYVNLATARAMDRAREVGVRKAVGADRRQLVLQFLGESALTIVASALLAVILAAALTPVVNRLAETQLTAALWGSAGFWAASLGLLAVATLAAGLYPSFVLSSFKPSAVLRGRPGAFGAHLWLRRGLVVLQFAATVVLVGGTAVVYDQLSYMRRMDIGLELDQVLTVAGPRVLPDGTEGEAAVNTFAEELRRLPSVRQVATSTTLPGGGFNWNGASVRKAEDDPTAAIRAVLTWVDTSFVSLYGLELAAGDLEEFRVEPDSNEWTWTLVANETAVNALGFASPHEAVGRPIDFGGNEAVIVAVVRDFNWSSAHTERQSVFFGRVAGGSQVSLRIGTDDIQETLAAVEAAFTRLFPGNVFRYAFADESFDEQYRQDERFATLFAFFAGLAVAIAGLGLLGLAAFAAQQRTKEIGVRKVLGASVADVVALLSRDFLKLVVAAVVVASPVAYFLMRRWLETFAYRIELGVAPFLVAGTVALVLALATVSTQALRAASADPVKALRYE